MRKGGARERDLALKKRIGLIFGGRSGEHEVSILSAQSIGAALDKDKYEVIPIGIDKSGAWRLGDGSRALLESRPNLPNLLQINKDAPALIPVAGPAGQALLQNPTSGETGATIDVFFPIIHGTYGEDGSLQGLLRLLNVPFVGAGVLGSAVGMDKDVMKRLLRDADIPIGDFMVLRESDRFSFEDVAERLGTPFFVKPANMGSSVGINKVSSSEQFGPAIADAFLYDRKIVIEEFIAGREIECSVLGNDSPRASLPGEILVNADFYSYEAKYLDENGAALEIPANLDPASIRRVQDLAVRTFQTLECSGMARVDFFMKEDGSLIVNEINTLPGFTRISMYPKLWDASGISFSGLLDELIRLAIERHAGESRLKRSYDV